MEVISDVGRAKSLIEKSISKYGCSAEHNYYCYFYNIEPWEDPYIFIFNDDTETYCILSKYDTHDNDWYFVVEPIAPEDKKISILLEALEFVFSKNIRKAWLELESKTRKSLLVELQDRQLLKVNKINYTLVWPVFDMTQWTGEKMEGKDWKDLRYYWNKFFRDHKVEFVTADKVPKEDLKVLVHEWKKKRTATDRVYEEYYLNAIEYGFTGYDVNRIMIVDDKIAAITAGFRSREGYYYSTIGLYNADIDRCNEVANMDDLINLKRLGYHFVDFGGQENKSLDFKKKFRPSYFYKTHIFSVVKK
jgi:hypothetical protein